MACDRGQIGKEVRIQKILVAVDGSPCSGRAVVMAKHLAEQERPKGVVILLCVISPIPMARVIPGGLNYLREVIPDLDTKRRQEAERVLHGAAAFFEGSDIRPETRIGEGHPADEILRMAKAEKIDLILMGSRGLTGASEFFLGSTSDAVVHYAHCPVLIIR